MTITTEVTWADLRTAYDDEKEDLRDAYDEIVDLATEEFGDDALDQPLPNDPDRLDDDERKLFVYQRKAQQFDQAAQSIEQRQNALARLEDEYGDGVFEIKMLTGTETMDIETELRMLAQNNDEMPMAAVELRRNAKTVDVATVDAPEGIPTETTADACPECGASVSDGDTYCSNCGIELEGEETVHVTPIPSECPNALTLALWEQVQAYNNAGETGFRAQGFGDHGRPAPTAAQSATPTPSNATSPSSAGDADE